MSIMGRVALLCGVVGGVWGLLAPTLVLVPIRGSSLLEMGGIVSEVLPWLGFIAVLGTLGLVGLRLHTRSHTLGKPFLWASAVAMLLVSLFTFFGVGLFFVPASALLLVAAIGLKRELSVVK